MSDGSWRLLGSEPKLHARRDPKPRRLAGGKLERDLRAAGTCGPPGHELGPNRANRGVPPPGVSRRSRGRRRALPAERLTNKKPPEARKPRAAPETTTPRHRAKEGVRGGTRGSPASVLVADVDVVVVVGERERGP